MLCIGWKHSQKAGKVTCQPSVMPTLSCETRSWHLKRGWGWVVWAEGALLIRRYLGSKSSTSFTVYGQISLSFPSFFFFYMNLHSDHFPSSTTDSRFINSFHSQIYPNASYFSFSEYLVVLTSFILLVRTWLCVPSFLWTLDYRCTDLSLTFWIGTYPRKIEMPLSDPHSLQILAQYLSKT